MFDLSIRMKRRHAAIVALAMATILGGAGCQSGGADETAIKNQLQDMGVLVAVGADGTHVGSVALSTLKDKTQLPEAVKLVSSLSRVTSLDMNGTAAGDAELALVGKLESLQSLSLKETPVDNAALAHLASLKNLESIHLTGTSIDDNALPTLAAMKSLSILDLSRTGVGKDLSPLASLPRLKWLVLRGNTLGPDALESLLESTSLSRVSLGDATVDEDAMERFRQQRPDVKVE